MESDGEKGEAPDEVPLAVARAEEATRTTAAQRVAEGPSARELAAQSQAAKALIVTRHLRGQQARRPNPRLPDRLPEDVLDAVKDKDLSADQEAREARDEAKADARRRRAVARKAEAERRATALRQQREAEALSVGRVAREHQHYRLVSLEESAGPPDHGVEASGPLSFLSRHLYGKRLKRMPSDQMQREARARKERNGSKSRGRNGRRRQQDQD